MIDKEDIKEQERECSIISGLHKYICTLADNEDLDRSKVTEEQETIILAAEYYLQGAPYTPHPEDCMCYGAGTMYADGCTFPCPGQDLEDGEAPTYQEGYEPEGKYVRFKNEHDHIADLFDTVTDITGETSMDITCMRDANQYLHLDCEVIRGVG